jgi:acyl carrier protein
MDKGDVIALLAAAFQEVANIDSAAVRPDASLFADLNADSMVVAEALLIVEERFHLKVSDDFSSTISTVGDLAEHILANSVGAGRD